MHRELSDTEVDGGDTESGCGARPARAATRLFVTGDELLDGNLESAGGHDDVGSGRGIGGVALIAVDLDDRTTVDRDVMVGIVAFRIVGMGGVGSVSRQASRGGQRPPVLGAVTTTGLDRGPENVFEERPSSSGGGR